MWKWERALDHQQMASNEIYGRYIDDIFLTTNESLETLHQMLNKANNLHPNIKLTHQIGKNVPFLDVFIQNQDRILTTSVYHKEAAEPYVLPFKSDHQRHILKNIIGTTLTRAVRYSSTLNTFENELRHTKLKLLYNGYPPRYIYIKIKEFFAQFQNTSLLVVTPENEKQFSTIQSKLLYQPTTIEKSTQSRINTYTIDKNYEDGLNTNQQYEHAIQQEYQRQLIVHYTHEQRLTNAKQDVHKIWNQTFSETPVIETKLIVGNRNNENTSKEMVSKRSSRESYKNTNTINMH